jgi:hypothetical protein
MNKFIELNTRSGDVTEIEFVNIDHILRFYLEDASADIVVLLTNGTNLLVTGIPIIELQNKLNDSN